MQAGWFALGACCCFAGRGFPCSGAQPAPWRCACALPGGTGGAGPGTSLPELAVNLAAMRAGHAGIALGNAVESINIANFGLVLGVAALVAPFARRAAPGRRPLAAGGGLHGDPGPAGGDSVLTPSTPRSCWRSAAWRWCWCWRARARISRRCRRVFAPPPRRPTRTGLALFPHRRGRGLAGIRQPARGARRHPARWHQGLVGSAGRPDPRRPGHAAAGAADRRPGTAAQHGDLALGNVIGGSVANLTLVLGPAPHQGPLRCRAGSSGRTARPGILALALSHAARRRTVVAPAGHPAAGLLGLLRSWRGLARRGLSRWPRVR